MYYFLRYTRFWPPFAERSNLEITSFKKTTYMKTRFNIWFIKWRSYVHWWLSFVSCAPYNTVRARSIWNLINTVKLGIIRKLKKKRKRTFNYFKLSEWYTTHTHFKFHSYPIKISNLFNVTVYRNHTRT